MNRHADLPARLGIWFAVALPWLNPFAPGPSPAVLQTLLSLGGVALLLVLSQVAQSPKDWPRLIAQAWLAAALLSSAMALLQYAGWSERLSPWVNVTPVGEAFGNLRQRNQFASLTSIGLLALLGLAVRPRASGPAGLLETAGWLAAAVLLSLGNAASSSRTGAAQLVMIAGFAVVWKAWRQPTGGRLLVAALAGYGIGTVLLPWMVGLDPLHGSILGRMQPGMPDCNSRLVLWRNVLQLIALRPGLGWGWGELDYAHFITLYPGPRFCDILDNAHNLPLHLAVELGVPLALLACGSAAWLVWRGRPWREQEPERQMAWGVLAVILLHSLLEYPLWYGPFQVAAGLSVVLLWRARPAGARAAAAGAAWMRGAALGLAVLLIAGVAYAAWDYQRISQIYLPADERAEAYRDDTLQKIKASHLFHDQVEFAELTITPLGPDNAAAMASQAQRMLHFSPEARVVQKLVDSALLLGRQDVATFYLARMRSAFPADYERWMSANRPAVSAPLKP